MTDSLSRFSNTRIVVPFTYNSCYSVIIAAAFSMVMRAELFKEIACRD